MSVYPWPLISEMKIEDNVSSIRLRDFDAIVAFHRVAQVATEWPDRPDYALAGVAGRYYEKVWQGHFSQAVRSDRLEAIKIQKDGKILGIARYGLIFAPESDIAKGRSGSWGALHQLYVDPACYGTGIGTTLISLAERRMAEKGAAHLFIKAPQKAAFCGFFDKRGAALIAYRVEREERDGLLFEVPWAIYVKDLRPVSPRARPLGRLLLWPSCAPGQER